MDDIRKLISEALDAGNLKMLSDFATEYFEKKGIVKLPLGSYWKYMYADWFSRALEENVLRENAYGHFVPVADETEELIETGRRGREVIYKKELKLSFARFDAFVDEYEKFVYAKEKEDEQMSSIAPLALTQKYRNLLTKKIPAPKSGMSTHDEKKRQETLHKQADQIKREEEF